jgi:SAM-dependent methyltransferase
MSEITHTLNTIDFARAFGADETEVSRFCGELIKNFDFRYSVCRQHKREEILLDAIKKCDNTQLAISGAHRKSDWRRGWGEILRDFHNSGGDLEKLVPKDWHGDRPLRYNGDYVIASSGTFERDFTLVFRHWLYQKYLSGYQNVYEFGCGTGHNLAVMAPLFPGKKLFGMDWVPESQELLAAIAAKHDWPITGVNFDFFHPDYKLKILPGSLVYTSSALEQLGSNYGDFLDYLTANRPARCVNVECLAEYYDESKLYDYVALRYHRARNYLNGFLTRLREMEKDRTIRIVATKRTGFGSLYHEGLMYVIWEML